MIRRKDGKMERWLGKTDDSGGVGCEIEYRSKWALFISPCRLFYIIVIMKHYQSS